RIVTGDAGRIRACSDRNSRLEHLTNRRCALCLLGAVAVDKILALKRHPVLYGDAAAERFDPSNISIRNGFAMIEEPVQTSEGNVTIDFFVDVQGARDGLVVGRVQAKWPTIFDELAYDALQVRFDCGWHMQPPFEKTITFR